MSDMYHSLSHSKWNCKYHLVFVPKYRKKAIFGEIRQHLGPIFHELARQKECQILGIRTEGSDQSLLFRKNLLPSKLWILSSIAYG